MPGAMYRTVGLVMRALAIALVLVAASSPARAEIPLSINANVGMSWPSGGHPLKCYPSHQPTRRNVLNLDVGYRFIRQVAVGVHVGARRYPWEDCGGNIPGSYQMYRGLNTATELGFVVQWSMSRFWVSGWLGHQYSEEIYTADSFAYAVAAGVDVYAHRSGHRIGVYLDLTKAEVDYSGDHHVSAGIAYRYW